MDILHVGTGAIRMPPKQYGGTESHIFNTARHMVGYGHRVTILDVKESGADRDAEVIEGVRFVRFPLGTERPHKFFIAGYFFHGCRTFWFALKAKRYLKKNTGFDVVHVHGPLIGLVLAWCHRGLRARLVFSDYSPGWFEPSLGVPGRVALWLAVRLMRRSAAVMVQNARIKKHLVGKYGFSPESIAVVHTGVATEQYRPGIDTDNISARYGFLAFNILFNGRIAPYKGVEYLVRAADILVNRWGRKDTLFLLVGPLAGHGTDSLEQASYVRKVRGLIRDSRLKKNVVLTGAVPPEDLRGLFAACDVFVLPSLSEASPQVIAQAMASARPVVGSRIAGITDLIQDGASGYLVEPASPSQLADKLEHLITHPGTREKMGRNGRRLAEKELDWSQVSRGMLQVYQRLIDGRKR
jgi:D-inositol-3-phosphate glycosyltransferase